VALRSIRMLVADDSRTVRAFFNDVIDRWPAQVELMTAANGLECMTLLEQGSIDIAFIDVNMPEMSGMEAVGRARMAGNKTFVVLMSAKSSDPRLELARSLKAYEYLVKPFSAQDVLSILKTYQRVLASIHTLIVDDSRTIRKVIRQVLERSVFRLGIEEAADGQSALVRFKNGGFDLVFLDYNMPGLNGLETLDQLLKSEPNTKVIMASAFCDEDWAKTATARGASALLKKPFFAHDVDRALHSALGLKMPGLTANWSPAHPIKPLLCPVDETEAAEIRDDGDFALAWAKQIERTGPA
jgi:CheY-like chemotaxis protein